MPIRVKSHLIALVFFFNDKMNEKSEDVTATAEQTSALGEGNSAEVANDEVDYMNDSFIAAARKSDASRMKARKRSRKSMELSSSTSMTSSAGSGFSSASMKKKKKSKKRKKIRDLSISSMIMGQAKPISEENIGHRLLTKLSYPSKSKSESKSKSKSKSKKIIDRKDNSISEREPISIVPPLIKRGGLGFDRHLVETSATVSELYVYLFECLLSNAKFC